MSGPEDVGNGIAVLRFREAAHGDDLAGSGRHLRGSQRGRGLRRARIGGDGQHAASQRAGSQSKREGGAGASHREAVLWLMSLTKAGTALIRWVLEMPLHLPVLGSFSPSAYLRSVLSSAAQSIPATSAEPAPPSEGLMIGSATGRYPASRPFSDPSLWNSSRSRALR
ncbi:hypothetical protein OKA06_10625 [Novosphingobium sp. MW5]|nr:hypothetical protein [Novosphingobium sp. MW5]